MHDEAFTAGRQVLGYPAPRFREAATVEEPAPDSTCHFGRRGDRRRPVRLGASPHEPFVFDNEKWEHTVLLRPFAIARTPVTQTEFAEFVEDRGYRRRDLWSEAGWRWRTEAAAEHPVYWKRETPGGGWLRREFDRWAPLEPRHPVIHANWYEAEAWCRWARRRLPTEAEWERAACGPGPLIGNFKRRYPWGDDPLPVLRSPISTRRVPARSP
jgi:iron(II)-dependent oxidoreductase